MTTGMFEPGVEGLPWAEQAPRDDAIYRKQIARLFAHSRFYRQKLAAAGIASAEDVGGLEAIATLPFTEKDELRATRDEANPIGTHLIPPLAEIARIFSTSGTTGAPSYVPLTSEDIADWVRVSSRSYSASGLKPGCKLVSTYGAGPFVAGVTLDAFNHIGVTHIPVGSGGTDRLIAAIELLKADTIALTPSYALHIAEWADSRGMDLAGSSVERLLVAGEPGGGEQALRARLETAWGADVTEAMGIGDICVSLWGECPEKQGMHFSGRDIVHFELIELETGRPVTLKDGAEGELVYTHLRHRAAPLLRFRSRDQVIVWTGACACGRTAPRVRCIGRTDDLLIVRGVNLFPAALREIVSEFRPAVSGVIAVRPRRKGSRQEPPLPVAVELGDGVGGDDELSRAIARRVREVLMVAIAVELLPHASLPRSTYKSRLVDWSLAGGDA